MIENNKGFDNMGKKIVKFDFRGVTERIYSLEKENKQLVKRINSLERIIENLIIVVKGHNNVFKMQFGVLTDLKDFKIVEKNFDFVGEELF